MSLLRKVLSLSFLFTFFIGVSPSHADANDFSFDSFSGVYELTLNKDNQNIAEMKVTETLVAEFPNFDQNHGIRRDIPSKSYDKFPGFVHDIAVTDGHGIDREFEVNDNNGFIELLIKPSDGSYVYGKQTYVIEYVQSWVINNYQDSSGFDEFYWDINGTGWKQSFGTVTATVKLDSALQDILVPDKIACYQGVSGSKAPCQLDKSNPASLVFTTGQLEGGENLTVSVPFTPGVVNTTAPNVDGTPAWYAYWVCIALIVLISLWSLWFTFIRSRRLVKQKFEVPQYKPAAEPGLLTTAIVARKPRRVYQAAVIELAVQNIIEIEKQDKDFIFRKTKEPAKNADQQDLLNIFGLTKTGDEFFLGHSMSDRIRSSISTDIAKYHSKAARAVMKSGYFLKRALGLPALAFGLVVLVLVVQFALATYLDNQTEAGFIFIPLMASVSIPFLLILLFLRKNLSPKGVEVVTYLDGLELYINFAEKDRLAFLQSPTGAGLKASQLTNKQVLKLYEELLPWAILLGKQKEWNKVLAPLYEDQGQPVWFIGGPMYFDSFNALDTALSSSLAVSTSGGAGGGGSSGGGGGGGGGGGI